MGKCFCPHCGAKLPDIYFKLDFLDTPEMRRFMRELWEKLGREPTVEEFYRACKKRVGDF